MLLTLGVQEVVDQHIMTALLSELIIQVGLIRQLLMHRLAHPRVFLTQSLHMGIDVLGVLEMIRSAMMLNPNKQTRSIISPYHHHDQQIQDYSINSPSAQTEEPYRASACEP